MVIGRTWCQQRKVLDFGRTPIHNTDMRRRAQIALAILFFALVGVIVWQVLRIRGPLYQGKSASYWMNYNYPGPNADRVFCEVWAGLGSNAVPFLVKALNRRDSTNHEITYGSFVRGLPPRLKSVLPTPSPPAYVVRSRAASALGLIGSASRPAIPAILRTMSEDEVGIVRNAATNALKAIDPEAAVRRA
jgi:hypothetical protein